MNAEQLESIARRRYYTGGELLVVDPQTRIVRPRNIVDPHGVCAIRVNADGTITEGWWCQVPGRVGFRPLVP